MTSLFDSSAPESIEEIAARERSLRVSGPNSQNYDPSSPDYNEFMDTSSDEFHLITEPDNSPWRRAYEKQPLSRKEFKDFAEKLAAEQRTLDENLSAIRQDSARASALHTYLLAAILFAVVLGPAITRRVLGDIADGALSLIATAFQWGLSFCVLLMDIVVGPSAPGRNRGSLSDVTHTFGFLMLAIAAVVLIYSLGRRFTTWCARRWSSR